jgi:transcriptional regulator with PAS, ATPase and Fis domain
VRTPEGTLAAPTKEARVMRLRAVVLEVVEGPDAGRTVRADRPVFVVGTGEGADLRLGDGTVSREHLRLTLREGGVHLRDEGSKNGTWLGTVRVADVTLTADAVLELGGTKVKLRLDPDAIDLPLSPKTSFGEALGESAAMRHVFSVLERAAPSDVTVLLEGESGVGKEVLARAVHTTSPRVHGPFVAVDCGAIPATLMEAELFGHQKGAFTGAVEARAGLFEQADGGTLFLDEIGELPLDLQPKLLRVLERREVRRVGGRDVRTVDVRVVAATNRRLGEAVRRGEFRQDLFYRLAVARVVVPPLRDRPEDVVILARALFRATVGDPSADIPEDLAAMLKAYRWPGNVRELRNVIDRYALLGIRDASTLFDGGEAPSEPDDTTDLATLPYAEARRRAIHRFEREYANAVLARAGGVVVKAAELAGIARPSFYRMLGRSKGRGDD